MPSGWSPSQLTSIAAIDELVGSSFEPLDSGRCAELLHGERGFWINDYIDSSDPPPAFGRFPHVQIEVLEARARAMIASASLSAAPGA